MRPAAAAACVVFALVSPAGAREEGTLRDLAVRGPARIELAVEYPPDDAVVNRSACGVFVAGRALVVQGEGPRLDVAIVLDISRSTGESTGVDLDGDGVLGRPVLAREGPIFTERNSDPDDSVLAAEVAAARLLMRGLDPQRTRLAVVTFSGEASNGSATRKLAGAADTIVPLTFDYARVDAVLVGVAGSKPYGNTDMAAGLDQATLELAPDADAEKIVIFFTDGQPTLPHGPAKERENVLAVFAAADRAARRGRRRDRGRN